MFRLLLVFIMTHLLVSFEIAFAQTKAVNQQPQAWIGYMTSTKISKQFALWNDFHYVPKGFFAARTGISYFPTKTISLTGGYAFLLLPLSSIDSRLKKDEHRPWAQAVFTAPLSTSISLSQRIRYDARFIENISSSDPEEPFLFQNRIRFMTTLKKTFGKVGEKIFTPYVSIADEVLLSFGKNITYNTFNQNRIMVGVGLMNPKIQYQIGYMNRFVKVGPTSFMQNHTLVVWITQRFSFEKESNKTTN